MTIKRLAEELGCSKTHISNLLNDLGLKEECSRIGNKIDIPEEVADKIRQAVNDKAAEQTTQSTKTDATAALIEQLRAKDAMIERLQQENMALVQTLQQHTYLLAQSTAPQQQEPMATDPEPAETHAETISNENKGLWSRIFGR